MTGDRAHANWSLLLWGVPVLAVLLSGCAAPSRYPAVAAFTFDQHEVVLGSAERQTVLTGFFLGGAVADLAVVHIDENDDRRVSIYAFGDGTWAPAIDAVLRPEVSFVDVAGIGGHDRLITYGGGRLSWFDPGSSQEHELVAVTCDFQPPPRGEVLHVKVTRDVNDDGRDDLVVPDVDGWHVFVQESDGTFADAVSLVLPPGMDRMDGADGYRYDPWASGRVHELDYDRDGRRDLAFWNEDHFEVHHQNEDGHFTATTTTVTTDVSFDSDQLASLAAPAGVRRRRMDHDVDGDLTGRVLHSLADMNGDGFADLVVYSLAGGSLMKMRSAYEVHFGVPAPDGGTDFTSHVGAAIRRDGITFGMDQHDFDRDGRVDMVFTTIDAGLFEAVGMLVEWFFTRSVSMDLEFYRMEDGVYSDTPSGIRRIKSDSPGESGEKTFFPAVLVGEVNGDSHSDLLVQHGQKELLVYVGVPGPEVFARKPQKVPVGMPRDEEYTWLADLDRDGRQDILMHHPSATEPHRLTVLIAR